MSEPDRKQPDSTQRVLRWGVAAVIRRGDGRMLAIRRSQSVPAPGMVCFPGGGIEPGEDEPAALRREMQEELGIEIIPGQRLWRDVTPWGVDLAYWSAEIVVGGVIIPDPQEVADVFWLSLEEMAAHDDLLESNHGFLEALPDMDGRKDA